MRNPGPGSYTLWASIGLSLIGIGYSTLALRNAVTRAGDALTVANSELRMRTAERNGLVGVLNTVPFGTPFLIGHDVVTGRPFRRDEPEDGLYLFVSPTCGHCVAAITELPLVAARADLAATVVVPMVAAASVEWLLREAGTNALPAIAEAVGGLVDLTPGHGVPLLVLVQHQRLADVWTGALDEETVAALTERRRAQ